MNEHNAKKAPEWLQGDAPVLVTGAGGFIGRAVVRSLLNAGANTRALVRSPGAGAISRLGAEVTRGTIASPGRALRGVDTVFHLAYDLRASGSENLAEFRKFLNAIAHAGVSNLVHMSSVVVHDGWPVGDLVEDAPITPPDNGSSYRGAKIAMEALISDAVKKGQLSSATLLRPTLVYGPGSRIWSEAVVERLRSGPILVPDMPRDHPAGRPFGLCHLVHVDDLARAAVVAGAAAKPGLRAYLISDPSPTTWPEYYCAQARALGVGTIEKRPFAELEDRLMPLTVGSVDHGPSLAARVSSKLRTIVGNDTIDVVGRRLRRILQSNVAEQYPDRFLFDLYTATGEIDVSRAEAELGFVRGADVQGRLDEVAAFYS
ncbi:NAD-dependent epimerase/dehydratase family protein [Ruegeria sediminis]|uniref:NAD-dependent epimerase/dehydratase family protein n=1 Tax=Ruegeria sediminis TaxID=2583820 RepID=A0ABY2WZL4_9RHOB|nr:NAD-dependent epimerase/dehydratase family protein [Ruegeria sediminis]TMV08440.1 NAD-dependent epimerase/dehydratase family protein [Ruegeria sediminis]